MLTKISTRFASKRDAQRALTNVRKIFHVAFRGAVVIEEGKSLGGGFFVHVPLGGTGFSAAELAGALHAYRDELNPRKRHPGPTSKLSNVDFNQKAYRGYLIRKNSLTGDMWIEKDGHLIGRVPASQSWAWAEKEIDALLDPSPNPKRRARKKLARKKAHAKTRTVKRYKITAQNQGKKMHYDGRHFSERPTVKSFALLEDAKQTAHALIRKYPILRKYRVRIESFP